MKIDDILTTARDSITVRRVYAEPVEQEGAIVIPAAVVSGGAGGGGGNDKEGQEGSGGGFGMGARPVGAYVIRNGDAQWKPAIDVNRLVTAFGVIAVVAMIAGMRLARPRTAQ